MAIYMHTALHRQVLAVLITGDSYPDFTAYIFPVLGFNHEVEQCLWEMEGCKLPESVARAIFPGAFEALEAEGRVWRP